MSKKYKNKRCPYCLDAASQTEEHIFSRRFFINNRGALPKAPACRKCNEEKARLEHYVLAVLPFGGRHADALANLSTMVPPRLTKNRRLSDALRQRVGRAWVQEGPGLIVPTSTVPIDAEKLRRLFHYIVKGLLWHSWGTYLREEDPIVISFPTESLDALLRDTIFPKYSDRSVRADLGNGTIRYEGIRASDVPQATCWRIQIYGGIHLATDDASAGTSSVILATTGLGSSWLQGGE